MSSFSKQKISQPYSKIGLTMVLRMWIWQLTDRCSCLARLDIEKHALLALSMLCFIALMYLPFLLKMSPRYLNVASRSRTSPFNVKVIDFGSRPKTIIFDLSVFINIYMTCM